MRKRTVSKPRGRLLSLLALLTLGACHFAPTYERPVVDLPPNWSATASASAAQSTVRWEDLYTDARLQALIRTALVNNHDLRLALARIEEARALWGVQQADQLPNVGVNVGHTASRTPAGVVNNNPVPLSTHRYDANLALLAFELDFWGRVANLSEAARRNFVASRQDQQVVRLGLISDVANAYFLVLESQTRDAVLSQTVQARQQTLALTERKREVGAASDLEVSLAQGALANAQSEASALRRQLAQAENALRVLVGGRLPADLPAGLPLAAQPLSLAWGANLSSAVLLNRPDVQASEARLMAANANIGAARAAFLPRMQITGSVGTASQSLGGLFESGTRAWTYNPNLQQPLFDAGRAAGNLDLAKARQVQAVALYERTVQQAFREVADLLVARETLSQQQTALAANLRSQQERLRLVEARLQQGAANQLEWLDAQREALAAAQNLASVQRQLLGSTAQLYKALGGGVEP